MNNINEELKAEIINDKSLMETIDAFYKHFEDNLRNYKRPVDYVERYLKVINGDNRSKVGWNSEGLTRNGGNEL